MNQTAHTSDALADGDSVLCLAPSIDTQIGEGATGTIVGFTRFSKYHPREAMVRFADDTSGWFWLRDLQATGGAA